MRFGPAARKVDRIAKNRGKLRAVRRRRVSREVCVGASELWRGGDESGREGLSWLGALWIAFLGLVTLVDYRYSRDDRIAIAASVILPGAIRSEPQSSCSLGSSWPEGMPRDTRVNQGPEARLVDRSVSQPTDRALETRYRPDSIDRIVQAVGGVRLSAGGRPGTREDTWNCVLPRGFGFVARNPKRRLAPDADRESERATSTRRTGTESRRRGDELIYVEQPAPALGERRHPACFFTNAWD